MKILTLFILVALLCVGLTLAGRAIFGMGDGMQMSDVACVNHCIDSSMFPVVLSSALPLLLFVVFSIVCGVMPAGESRRLTPTRALRRMTEPIRLFRLFKTLSPVMIRD